MITKSSLLRTVRGVSLVAIIVAAGAAPYAVADDLTEWSAPATGADMWTGIMGRQGMFAPHADNCDASEEFVPVHTDQYGVSLGFCIEENEREGVAIWTAARAACLADNKRLPEPGEFQYACLNGTGLNDMQDDWEWASNFSSNSTLDAGVRDGVSAPLMGDGSCAKATTGWFASNDATEATVAYRCVR